MNLREKIREDVEKATKQLTTDNSQLTEIEVARTSDPKFGDYSTNVALRLAGAHPRGVQRSSQVHPGGETGKRSPLEFAKLLADKLKELAYVEKVEVAGPGFINFFIKPAVWQKEVEDVLAQKKLNLKQTAKKVIVEFTDPNPFKEFHIGHLYSNIVGEAISRLLEAIGARVKRANYQGDVGMHVAKTIWGISKVLGETGETFADQEKKPLKARVFFLGQAYVLGAKEFEASDQVKKDVALLNKKIFEKDPEVQEFYQKGRAWSLEYFEAIYKRLGTKFDFYYFESAVGKVGADLVRENLNKVFIESEGAIIFPGEKYGLHNRVFINSQGFPTYEAKELGLAPTKYKDFNYDESLIVTGSEIIEYFKVLLAALDKVAADLAVKTRHIAHGMVRMPGGKISSRLGNVISCEWLLNEAVDRVKKEFKQVSEEVAEEVGVGAVKYALLKGNIGQDIKFSFEESITLAGNSGPYLQYTYARCQSVLAKSEGTKFEMSLSGILQEEDLLLRQLGLFGDIVLQAAEDLAPNLVANYLYETAQKFNTLYNDLPILKANEDERTRRLFLTESTADILQKGLYLLGVSAPEKM